MSEHWTEGAACRGAPLGWFFPQAEEEDYDSKSIELGLETCKLCSVSVDCREYAMSTEETRDHGVWGGTTPDQRRMP